MNDIEAEFNAALSRYEGGEDLLSLVDDFKKIINQIPNHFYNIGNELFQI